MSTDSIDQILTRIERRIAIRRGLGVVGVAVAALVVYFGTGFLGTRPVPEIVRFAQFDFFFAEFLKYAQPTFVDLTFYTQEGGSGRFSRRSRGR